MQMFHSVCPFIIVNDIMVTAAHQDQVVITVAFFWSLTLIEARAFLVPCFYVTDFPDNFFAINERGRAFRKCTSVTRFRKEPLNGFCTWTSQFPAPIPSFIAS